MNNGIYNQLLSHETLLGLGYRYPGLVFAYNYKGDLPNFREERVFYQFYDRYKEPKVFFQDLFDLPDINFNFLSHPAPDLPEPIAMFDFFSAGQDHTDLDDFANNRSPIDPSYDYNFDEAPFSYYSIFFHDRDAGLEKLLHSIQPKKEYQELAHRVANFIGDFNGLHLRRSDHVGVIDILEHREHQDLIDSVNQGTLLVATDDPDLDLIPPNAINVDRLILNNFKKDFESLPLFSPHALSFLSSLVMTYSADFVGTITSTYSGYIQRKIFEKNTGYEFKLIGDYNKPIRYGKYPWTASNISPKGMPNYREWPESKLTMI